MEQLLQYNYVQGRRRNEPMKQEDGNTESSSDFELVQLSIVMTYPVKWTVYQIVNNFIQNFYDALGNSEFCKSFHVEYTDGTLMMSADKGFAKEWLYYMGASSKRGTDEFSAGGFGEGFKIAALTSFRDYGLDIEMEARDWKLHVTQTQAAIDGHPVRFLAYEVSSRPFCEASVLYLRNTPMEFYEKSMDIIHNFYYDGNPLFGRLIAKGNDYAIYEAVERPGKKGVSGYLFASCEMRNSWYDVPLVFCNHRYHPSEDDRDRLFFSLSDTKWCILEIVEQLDAARSMELLGYLKKKWSGAFQAKYTFDWTTVITRLVENICKNKAVRDQFMKEYSEKLIIRDTRRLTYDKDKRIMAYEWFSHSSLHEKYHLVHPAFRPLGIQTICELCQKMDGFTAERSPDLKEKKYIEILRMTAEKVLKDLVCQDIWPDCKILVNKKAPVEGYTKITKYKGKKNIYGMRAAASARYVYLQAYLFADGVFKKAFVVYAHELLHQFGGDNTLQFHRALVIMNRKILENRAVLKEAEERWEHV